MTDIRRPEIGRRAAAAAVALKPLGLSLLVSPDEFVITAGPDDKATVVAICTSMDGVEAFIADRQRIGAVRPAQPVKPRKPRVSDIVHYVSYGTPGGEYGKECRAAIVTEVNDKDPVPEHGVPYVGLCVLNPTGQFFNQGVMFDDGAGQPGDPGCPDKVAHGNPFRYCACGWTEPNLAGGSWHRAGHE